MRKFLSLLVLCFLFSSVKAQETVVYAQDWSSVDLSDGNTYDLQDWESRVLDNLNVSQGFFLMPIQPIQIIGLGYPEGNAICSFSTIRLDYSGGLLSGIDAIAYKTSIQLPANAKKITLTYFSGGSIGGAQCMDYHAAYVLPEGDGFNYTTARKGDVVSYLELKEDNIVSEYRILNVGDKAPRIFEADLMEYAGQTVTLIFRHYNSGNQEAVIIGDVKITAELDDDVEPTPTAQLLLEENFNYNVDEALSGQGDWGTSGSGTANPILVDATSLTYPGYIDSNIGGAAKITSFNSNNVYKTFEKRYFGSVYASALINFSEIKTGSTGADYFLNFNVGDGSAATADGQGRVAIKVGSSTNKFILGVGKNAATNVNFTWGEEEYDINTTYLIVLKYTFEEEGNDIASLFVNPVIGENEPAAYVQSTKEASSASMSSIGALILRKGPSNIRAYTGVVDAIRVASTWEELFKIPTTKTEVIPNKNRINFGTVYDYDQHTDTILIKGRNLSEDITLTSSHEELTFSKTTITANEAKEGVKIAVILTPTILEAQSATVSIATAGASTLNIPINWDTRHVDVYSDLNAIQTAYLNEPFDAYVRGLEDVVVTDKQLVKNEEIPGMGGHAFNTTYQYFIQDSKGGFVIEETFITPSEEAKYNLGDTFAKLTGKVIYAAADSIIKFTPEFYELIATNNTNVASTDVTSIADLTANAWDYNARLVTIHGVAINGLQVTQGENAIELKSKYVESDLALDFAYLTGIFQTTKEGKNYILPRGESDIQLISASSESLDLGRLWIGEDAQFTVTLKGEVTEDVTVQLPEYIQSATTTIAKEDIDAETGVDLALTITPQSLGSKAFTIAFVYGSKSIELNYVFESIKRPAITLSSVAPIDFGTIYINDETPATRTINVKGSGLVGNISVSTTESIVLLGTTTIEKEEAEAENGYDLSVTVVPTTEGVGYTTITLTTESALESSSFIILWKAEVKVVSINDIENDQINTWLNGTDLHIGGIEIDQVDVFTVSGIKVLNATTPIVALGNLENGIYIVKVKSVSGKTFATKIILK